MHSLNDKKRSFLNISISVFTKVILLVLAFIVRRILIQQLGNEYNGINSLFLSILGILSIAELGIGTAITFCMYKPIVEGDNEKVSALFVLMKRVYLVIAGTILVLGIIVSFFLPFLAKEYTVETKELYFYFYLFLLSSVLSYFSGAKSALICAYKNNFVATLIYSFSMMVQYVLQIISIILFKSFYLYLISKSIFDLVQYIVLSIYCRKKYYHLFTIKSKLDDETKKDVKKNIGALFLHQITANVFSSVDSLVISSMFGLIILGKYSNYFLIMNSMNEILKLFFTSMTSIIGQYMIKKSKDEVHSLYSLFNNLNIVLGFIFYLGFFAVSDDLIMIFFGEDLLLDRGLLMLVTVTYFTQFLRQACANFKDAAGLFYRDRFIVLAAAILNIILSIVFALVFGIYGVIIATFVLILTIYLPVDSFLFHNYQLDRKCYKDILYKLIVIGIFTGAVFLMNFWTYSNDNVYLEFLANGFISVGISLTIVIIIQAFSLKKSIATLKNIGFRRRHENE